jgi:hypothetical protein
MIRSPNRGILALVVGPSLLFAIAAGCGGGSSEGLPPEDVARRSLEAALSAWRDGGKPGQIAGTQPIVEVHDTPWSLGDRLSSYEIVGEDKSGAGLKYSVRLSLAKPERVEEADYYVLGRDPVMVFRDEDYERNINMVNGPSVNKSANPKWKTRR